MECIRYKGIYAINPDFSDALGQYTNNLPPQASFPGSGAQWWGASTSYAPFRMSVGTDDTLYVGDCAYASGAAGCPVWMIDANLTTPIEMFTYIGTDTATSSTSAPCSPRLA